MSLVRVAAALVGLAFFSRVQSACAQPAGPAPAEPTATVVRMPTPVDGVGVDLVAAFSGYNLVLYGVAVASTGIMAFGGADHGIQRAVQLNIPSTAYGDFSQYAGYLVPLILAPTVYLAGLALDDATSVGAGSAASQSLLVAILTTAVLKISVGRVYPSSADPGVPASAHQFRPFHYLPLPAGPAWPSGHTVATTSVVAALTGYYPDELWIPLLGYPVATAIGFGLIDGNRHWTSDVIAGGFIGHAIGYTTGRAFRRRLRGDAAPTDGLAVVPLTGRGITGFALAGPW